MSAVQVFHPSASQVVLDEDGGVEGAFPLPGQDHDALPQGDERGQLVQPQVGLDHRYLVLEHVLDQYRAQLTRGVVSQSSLKAEPSDKMAHGVVHSMMPFWA